MPPNGHNAHGKNLAIQEMSMPVEEIITQVKTLWKFDYEPPMAA